MAWPKHERGARLGWLLGLGGGCIWMPLMAGVMCWLGDVLAGVVLAVCFVLTLALLWMGRPWAWPDTKMWKLLLTVLSPIVVGAGFMIFRAGMLEQSQTALSPLVLLLLFVPMFTLGGKTWRKLHTPSDEY